MDLYGLLALKGTRKIVLELNRRRAVKYSDLVEVVGYATTASRALKALQKFGFLEKKALTEPYRPVVYYLTDKGRTLAKILTELEQLAATA